MSSAKGRLFSLSLNELIHTGIKVNSYYNGPQDGSYVVKYRIFHVNLINVIPAA